MMMNTQKIKKVAAAFFSAGALLVVVSVVALPFPSVLSAQNVTPDTPPGVGGGINITPNPGSEWTWTPVAGDEPTDTSTPSTIDSYNGAYCATGTNTFNKLSDVFRYFTCLIQRALLPLAFACAGLAFIWGTVKFMTAHDSAEKEQGQQFMLWGIVGFAVMLSLWGLINLIGITFHINNVLPVVPTTTHIQ